MVKKQTLLTTFILAVAVFVVTISIWAHFGTKNTPAPDSEDKAAQTFPSDGSPLDFFGVGDGLDIKWYHAANSLEEMEEALAGEYQMLEGDIILDWSGFPNQTDTPVMAHPPRFTSDNTLDNWLASILARPDKAPKLDFKGEDVIEPALQALQSFADVVEHPVWANADVVQGPGSSSQPISFHLVISLVEEYFPNLTLSLGWTTGCCDELYTRDMMTAMWERVHNISQPVTFPARAALFKDSWLEFKWLLEKDPERFSITVWTPSDSLNWEGATPYDMLYVRNDVDKRLIYYDLPGPKFDEFKQLSVTAGSLFNHFEGLSGVRDGIVITWAHGVNSQQELKDALNTDVMMLEADVLLRGQGLPNQTDTPVMAHPPDTNSDITLQQWLGEVLNSTKGIKLDFKYTNVLEPSMKVMESFKGSYEQPVWINADIFVGPGRSQDEPVNATEFRRLVLEYFPECTLSIGWTTTRVGTSYTPEMVAEMMSYARDFVQPITFPVRAMYVRDSWDALVSLLDESRSYTMTIWSSSDDVVDVGDLVYVREHYDVDRIYYDLPDDLMEEFLGKLNMTLPLSM